MNAITLTFNELPEHFHLELASKLTPEEACTLKRTCSHFHRLFTENKAFVRQLTERNWQMLILSGPALKNDLDLKSNTR